MPHFFITKHVDEWIHPDIEEISSNVDVVLRIIIQHSVRVELPRHVSEVVQEGAEGIRYRDDDHRLDDICLASGSSPLTVACIGVLSDNRGDYLYRFLSELHNDPPVTINQFCQQDNVEVNGEEYCVCLLAGLGRPRGEGQTFAVFVDGRTPEHRNIDDEARQYAEYDRHV